MIFQLKIQYPNNANWIQCFFEKIKKLGNKVHFLPLDSEMVLTNEQVSANFLGNSLYDISTSFPGHAHSHCGPNLTLQGLSPYWYKICITVSKIVATMVLFSISRKFHCQRSASFAYRALCRHPKHMWQPRACSCAWILVNFNHVVINQHDCPTFLDSTALRFVRTQDVQAKVW